MEAPSGATLERSVEGPSEEYMVVSDGAAMEGKWKRRNWGERADRERFLTVMRNVDGGILCQHWQEDEK
jgi:hypothetical protein